MLINTYLVLHYPKKTKDDMVFYWSDKEVDAQKYANDNDNTFIFKSITKKEIIKYTKVKNANILF